MPLPKKDLYENTINPKFYIFLSKRDFKFFWMQIYYNFWLTMGRDHNEFCRSLFGQRLQMTFGIDKSWPTFFIFLHLSFSTSGYENETHNLTQKMYAYYVEVPRMFIFWSNYPFILPVEFLQIFHFFVLEQSAHCKGLCDN